MTRPFVALAVASALVGLVACGGSNSNTSASYGEPPRTPAPGKVVNGTTCGTIVFATAACENVVDGYCCNEQIACANDAACDRFMRCRYACKNKGDKCTNACALEIVNTYGQDAAKAGLEKFGTVADCSKRTFTAIGDPPGARCDDDS